MTNQSNPADQVSHGTIRLPPVEKCLDKSLHTA